MFASLRRREVTYSEIASHIHFTNIKQIKYDSKGKNLQRTKSTIQYNLTTNLNQNVTMATIIWIGHRIVVILPRKMLIFFSRALFAELDPVTRGKLTTEMVK